VGFDAGTNLTTGSNNIDVGNVGIAAEADTIRIGTQGTQVRSFIAGINGTPVTGSAVVANAAGQLGIAPSSKRFKDEIKPMNQASETILALEPVTFRYKKEFDPNGIAQFGLVAEQVEKVNPDLVARDESGKAYTVRYEAVNAMLLNEFLKEHRKVEQQDRKLQEQETRLEKQETAIVRQQQQIQALASTLEKVSDQLAVNKSGSLLIANKQ